MNDHIQLDKKKVRIGVLGAGHIAQAAHFDSCKKAYNIELLAICDVAEDLLEKVTSMHGVIKKYSNYDLMLNDEDIDAVIIATDDSFHVPMSIKALEAGKHVLCEKPIGINVEEVEELKKVVTSSKKIFQVGHMKRFDAGLQAAKSFIDNEMGDIIALKAWYCDSTHRYEVTNAVQPFILKSSKSLKPKKNPKDNLQKYYMLAHGSHLIDLTRYFGGEIIAVRSRLLFKAEIWCWFIEVEFANGSLGHLDLTIAVRMDWNEGFQIYGKNGSVIGKIYNPWLYKTSDVDIFKESLGTSYRVLGADGHFYRRQIESFADVILQKKIFKGASVDDGVASVRAMIAIARSIESQNWVKLDSVSGGL